MSPEDPITLLQQGQRELWARLNEQQRMQEQTFNVVTEIKAMLAERCQARGVQMADFAKRLEGVESTQGGRQCVRHDERLKSLERLVKWVAGLMSIIVGRMLWDVYMFYHSGGLTPEVKAMVDAAVKAALAAKGQ